MSVATESATAVLYDANELTVLKECFQLTSTMLSDFIGLIEVLEDLVNENNAMIQTVEDLQVPYCYEYLRLEFQVAFNEVKEYIDDLKRSMFYFPNEIESFLHYIKNEPSSNNYMDIFGMLDATCRFYRSRYEVLKDMLQNNKYYAQKCYEETRMIPRPCGA